jgi:hypothetical protein
MQPDSNQDFRLNYYRIGILTYIYEEGKARSSAWHTKKFWDLCIMFSALLSSECWV